MNKSGTLQRAKSNRLRVMAASVDNKPTAMPKKHAIKMMLVKNVRKITVLPNQRMQESSRNRIRNEIRKRRARGEEAKVFTATIKESKEMRMRYYPTLARMLQTNQDSINKRQQRIQSRWQSTIMHNHFHVI